MAGTHTLANVVINTLANHDDRYEVGAINADVMDEELEAANYHPFGFDCPRDTSQIGCGGSQR